MITKEDLKNAPEKSLFTTNIYDAILIEPQNKDSYGSGYRDLNIYGMIKTERHEKGFYIEKIKTSDNLKINSFFKKLKGFQISIDIPYLENIIHIYCKNYLIKVCNQDFKFIKDKRK